MNNNKNFFLIFLALTLSLSQKVSADSPPVGLYISPALGYLDYSNKTDLEHKPALSIGLGYQFNNLLGLEMVYLLSNSETQLSPVFDVDYQQVRLDALFHLPGSQKLHPFAVVGAGEATYKVDLSVFDDERQTELNLGIGVMGYLSDHLALRGDIRGLFGQEDELGHFLFNIGITYFLKSHEIDEDYTVPDSDNDGVPDTYDQCPETPASVKVNNRGCPLDSDGDGIVDYKDQCPDTPQGVQVDANGCPLKDVPPSDGDGDGVLDEIDECPNTPAGAKVDAKGCRILLKENVEISMQLQFRSGSAEVLPAHKKEIARVGEFMKQYPDTKVVIEGHTDSQGDEKYNEQLSLLRAKSVRLSLISDYDINPGRMKAMGLGETQPIANNTTKEGRAQNRRVIAVIKATVTSDDFVKKDRKVEKSPEKKPENKTVNKTNNKKEIKPFF